MLNSVSPAPRPPTHLTKGGFRKTFGMLLCARLHRLRVSPERELPSRSVRMRQGYQTNNPALEKWIVSGEYWPAFSHMSNYKECWNNSNLLESERSTCMTRPGFMIKMHFYVRNLHFVAAALERLHHNRQTKHVQVHLCKNLSAFPLLYFGTSFYSLYWLALHHLIISTE